MGHDRIMYRPFPLGKNRCLQRSSDVHPLPPRLEALLDQARGVFIADGDGRRPLADNLESAPLLRATHLNRRKGAMNSRTLYVIGNGFDLWHGIPSSLAQFKQYVC